MAVFALYRNRREGISSLYNVFVERILQNINHNNTDRCCFLGEKAV